jgi:catechol 2,3-dioxygenase-like lactoylglutathione lyase family enzyme
MTTAADVAVRKFHMSLNVSNLEHSVAFYSVLLGRPAAKQRAGYAKFELDDPPLVLSLIPTHVATGGNLNHVGLRVLTSEELVAIQRRVEEAGFPTTRQDDVECCYSRQTKFWIGDPDRVLWEVYVFHEDTDDHGEGSVPKLEHNDAFAKKDLRPRVVWEHRIPEILPLQIPHAENSLDEINLEGTINLNLEPGELARILIEALRSLRPGGSLRIDGLASDQPLTVPLPALPGPAGVVQRVPSAVEPMRAMVEAGLIEIRFEKLSRTAHFTIGGVEMREVVLTGRKPGYRPAKLTHQAVYLGPLAQVTDDFGNIFRRGERVRLNIHDWHVLSRSAVAEQFQFFAQDSNAVVLESCCANDPKAIGSE